VEAQPKQGFTRSLNWGKRGVKGAVVTSLQTKSFDRGGAKRS
jgi:hypothetical protein